MITIMIAFRVEAEKPVHPLNNAQIKLSILINNQVLRKIKIAVKSDVKNWAYISLR